MRSETQHSPSKSALAGGSALCWGGPSLCFCFVIVVLVWFRSFVSDHNEETQGPQKRKGKKRRTKQGDDDSSTHLTTPSRDSPILLKWNWVCTQRPHIFSPDALSPLSFFKKVTFNDRKNAQHPCKILQHDKSGSRTPGRRCPAEDPLRPLPRYPPTPARALLCLAGFFIGFPLFTT